ncbi:protease [Amniota adenovirus 1]|nr:protease [Amniota adenovirus 1]
MSGTSETEIAEILKDLGIIDKFLGTFDRRFNGFPHSFGRMESTKTAIVNTGYREKGGVHWLALGWNPVTRVLHVFDPLGWRDDQLKRYYDGFTYSDMIRKTSGKPGCITVRRVGEAVQCSCSGACGLFCVLFLYCFDRNPSKPESYITLDKMKGEPPSVISDKWQHLHRNQDLLYDFLYKNSNYFRRNYSNIVNNTRIGLMSVHQ